MKKVKKFIKSNIKIVVAFIIGVVIAGGSVAIVSAIAGSSVTYTDTNNIGATTVQGAIDKLGERANTWINPNNTGTPKYYAFGTYKGWCSSTDTKCNSYSAFPTTSTNPPSGKNVYAAKYADDGYGVCINRNGTPHCFRGQNWIAEAQHIKKVFSGANDRCNVASYYVNCYANDFDCVVGSDGSVNCVDDGATESCSVKSNGSVNCGW